MRTVFKTSYDADINLFRHGHLLGQAYDTIIGPKKADATKAIKTSANFFVALQNEVDCRIIH